MNASINIIDEITVRNRFSSFRKSIQKLLIYKIFSQPKILDAASVDHKLASKVNTFFSSSTNYFLSNFIS